MLKNYRDKVEMYISSLWLLFLMIIIITIDVPLALLKKGNISIKELIIRNLVPIISFIFFVLGIFYVYRFNYKLKGSRSSYFKIKSIKNKNYEHLTFLTTYIIPLICFDLNEIRYIIVLILLLIIIGAIYIGTDMFYANPTLALLGYKLYEVNAELRDGFKEQIIIISRDEIDESSNILYRKLDENIYFVRRKK